MSALRLTLPESLLSGATAATYTQQTRYGVPAPALRAAQLITGMPVTWQTLPRTRGGQLQGSEASLALQKSSDARVLGLARDIIRTQADEMYAYRQWLIQRGF